jgi:hypothetical protein
MFWPVQPSSDVKSLIFGKTAVIIYSHLVLFLKSHVYTDVFVCDGRLFLRCLRVTITVNK